MSVHRSGDGSGQLSYADHDIHWISHEVDFLNTSDVTATGEAFADEQQFDITERGLAPDEIAELRAMVVNVTGTFTADGPQDSINSLRVDVESGFNTTGDEFVTVDPAEETLDLSTADDDVRIRTKDTDEVGQLFSSSFLLSTPYDDDSNGNGAGGTIPVYRDSISFTDLLGSGPIVDANDDFVSRIALDVQNTVTTQGCHVTYGLYYAVEEIEGGRTRFGR